MSQLEEKDDFYAAGRKLAQHITNSKGKEISTATLQALIRDFLPQHEEVQEALRSIVARPDFRELVKLAGSRKGVAQKCSVVESLKKIYSIETVEAAENLMRGILGLLQINKPEEYDIKTQRQKPLPENDKVLGNHDKQRDAYQDARNKDGESLVGAEEYISARLRKAALSFIALTALVSGAYWISLRDKKIGEIREQIRGETKQSQTNTQSNAQDTATSASSNTAESGQEVEPQTRAPINYTNKPELKWAHDWNYSSNTHLVCGFRSKGSANWYDIGVPKAIDGWIEKGDGSSKKIIKVFLNSEMYSVIYNGYDQKGWKWSWDIGQNGYELKTERFPGIIGCLRKDVLDSGGYFGYPNTRGTRSE